MENINIYQTSKYRKRAEKILQDSDIPKKDKDRIFKFIEHIEYTGVKEKRVTKYLIYVRRLRETLNKDFDKATKDDIKRLVAQINKEDLSEWTKHDMKVILKRFYKWLLGNDKDYPDIVRDLVSRVDTNKVEEPDILTEAEIKLMVENALNRRDEALIMVLWETGARVGEILTLRIKDVEPFQYGFKIKIQQSKTDKRTIPLIQSAPFLSAWLNEHSQRDNREAPLWKEILKNKPLRYDSLRMSLKRTGERAGIKKRIHPHLLRHSRATFLANSGLTEFQMDKMFGWKLGSDVPAIYIRRAGINLENPLLKLNGIETSQDKKSESKLKTKTCLVCAEVNPATAKVCKRCYRNLDIKELQTEQDKLLNIATENPHLLEQIAKQVTEEIFSQLRGLEPEKLRAVIEEKTK